MLLRAWPEIRRRTGARLRLIGTDPLQYRLLHTRHALRRRWDRRARHRHERGADAPSSPRRRLFVSPALGGESFGLVLAEAFATATPVVASDIPGFADVVDARDGRARPARRRGRAHRRDRGAARRRGRGASRWAAPPGELAEERYSWDDVARAARGDLRAGRRMTRPEKPLGAPASPVALLRWSPVVLIWWRGPEWDVVRDVVHRRELDMGRRGGRAEPALGRRARGVAWHTVIKQAMPAPQPRFRTCSRRSASGLFANVVLPGRVGELARVAVLARRMPERRRQSGRR